MQTNYDLLDFEQNFYVNPFEFMCDHCTDFINWVDDCEDGKGKISKDGCEDEIADYLYTFDIRWDTVENFGDKLKNYTEALYASCKAQRPEVMGGNNNE